MLLSIVDEAVLQLKPSKFMVILAFIPILKKDCANCIQRLETCYDQVPDHGGVERAAGEHHQIRQQHHVPPPHCQVGS